MGGQAAVGHGSRCARLAKSSSRLAGLTFSRTATCADRRWAEHAWKDGDSRAEVPNRCRDEHESVQSHGWPEGDVCLEAQLHVESRPLARGRSRSLLGKKRLAALDGQHGSPFKACGSACLLQCPCSRLGRSALPHSDDYVRFSMDFLVTQASPGAPGSAVPIERFGYRS